MIDTMITRKASEIKKLPNYDTYDYFTEQYKWLDQDRTQNKSVSFQADALKLLSDWLKFRVKIRT